MTPKSEIRSPKSTAFRAVVIGASAGGLNALAALLSDLPQDFPLPVLVVQHLLPGSGGYLAESLSQKCAMAVKEAEEKEKLRPGCVYLAPPDYHLLVERDEALSLSIDEKVHYSRPSIDVLFESAAYAWSSKVIGVILTGASADGAKGLALIKARGGMAIVQDPATAEQPIMPQAAIDAVDVDYVLGLAEMGEMLVKLGTRNAEPGRKRKDSEEDSG